MYSSPLGYFISWRTYATWLHGDERGSVDRQQNAFDAPVLPTAPNLMAYERTQAKHAPRVLDEAQRAHVDRTIREVCAFKVWTVHELNVRTNHVHVVVTAPGSKPEPIMNALKAWSTRRLREAGLVPTAEEVWSRGGNTIYLFKPEKLAEKCAYVRDGQ